MSPRSYIIYSSSGAAVAGDALPVTEAARSYVDEREGYYIADDQGNRIYPEEQS